MSHLLYSLKRLKICLAFFFASIIVIWSFILAAIAVANSVGAIIISGAGFFSFNNDVNNMTAALTNTSVGYGISTSNIYSGHNQSFAEFQSAVSQMNNNGISELHIYVSTHGNKNIIQFSDRTVSKNEFISAINQSSASTKHVVLDSCYSGTFYNDLSGVVGQDGTVITSTDENHVSRYFTESFFTGKLSDYLQDAETDENGDGKVTYIEAMGRVKRAGGWLPNLGHPKSISIPTLSEWKQIFLTLLMLSLVMGFMRDRSSALSVSTGSVSLKPPYANLLAFNRHIYTFALKWVGGIVVLGIAGVIVVSGHLKVIDLFGTLFCAPLVAYILHLVMSLVHD